MFSTTNGTIGGTNVANVPTVLLLIKPSSCYILNFYVYILVFLLGANIIMVKTAIICLMYKSKV